MARGVFVHRVDSIYNDRPAEQYQFPRQYLSRALQCIGDWILYYEPVKAGSSGYFAVAKVERIVPDPTSPAMHLALIEPGSFLQFGRMVPFRDGDSPIERGLLNEQGRISGRAQSAVRPISLADFNRIIDRGLGEDEPSLPRIDDHTEFESDRAFEETTHFVFQEERERVKVLTSRIVRDRVFRKIVLNAYDCRCAVTALKIINGGGRAEVEAAHIMPVEHGGPDIVNNGIALSGTAHWMFDRGLFTFSDEMDIQVSRQVNDIESVWNLINPSRKALWPIALSVRPHPHFLAWHREQRFKH